MSEGSIYAICITSIVAFFSLLIVITYISNADIRENNYKLACIQAKGDLVWQPSRAGALAGSFLCKLKGKE